MNKENIYEGLEFPLLEIEEVPIMQEFGNCPYAVGFGDISGVRMSVEKKYATRLDELAHEGKTPVVYPFIYDEEDKYKYNMNNGVLCITTRNRVYVTSYSPVKANYFDEIGFKHDPNLFVPLSNKERILDPELDKRWKKILKG